MRILLLTAVLVALPFADSTAADPPELRVHIIGTGGFSCGAWVAKRINDNFAQAWILGYWSGLNTGVTAFTEAATSVGSSTDADGIIEEVRLLCRREPSLAIYTATANAYAKLRDAKR